VAVAAGIGNSALINWLIDEGFSHEDPDVFHLTPLMRAVVEGHVDAVRTLLRRGASVDARHGDSIKSSAMSCVTDRAILKILLDAGGELADIRGNETGPSIARLEATSGYARRLHSWQKSSLW
jgi:ankyrin repeat protein